MNHFEITLVSCAAAGVTLLAQLAYMLWSVKHSKLMPILRLKKPLQYNIIVGSMMLSPPLLATLVGRFVQQGLQGH